MNGVPLSKISTRTLLKWQKQLLEMNTKTSGKFWSHINYSLTHINLELKARGEVNK